MSTIFTHLTLQSKQNMAYISKLTLANDRELSELCSCTWHLLGVIFSCNSFDYIIV